MDEASLITALQQNSQAAFKYLVEQYKGPVFKTCYRFVNDRFLADDLAQEVFTEVFLSVKQFNEKSKISTWLYRIAVNKSIDYLRKQNRKKRWALFSPVSVLTDYNKHIADNGNPHHSLENQERQAILDAAIARLPEQQKIAFTLSKFDDLSYQEIASVMDTSVSAVESLLHRAKQNLKKQLEQYYQQNLH